ncbi:MAG: biopolymer transporter ExbD [Helicobacteraceae bacterium]|jgi:biopolymer transport protein ExbD|nr:biopolymer transporter ExbD [Helicobacteraceae bacterium]
MRLKRIDSINVIPFIDIMLVLLAIVLTTATFISQGAIKVALPEAKTTLPQTPAQGQKRVEIAINESDEFFMDKEPVNFYTLLIRLDSMNRADMIIIRADKESRFSSFIKLVDALKERKLENVSIATIKGDIN